MEVAVGMRQNCKKWFKTGKLEAERQRSDSSEEKGQLANIMICSWIADMNRFLFS